MSVRYSMKLCAGLNAEKERMSGLETSSEARMNDNSPVSEHRVPCSLRHNIGRLVARQVQQRGQQSLH